MVNKGLKNLSRLPAYVRKVMYEKNLNSEINNIIKSRYSNMRNSGLSRNQIAKQLKSELYNRQKELNFTYNRQRQEHSIQGNVSNTVDRIINGMEELYKKRIQDAEFEIDELYWTMRDLFFDMYEQGIKKNKIIEILTQVYSEAVEIILNKYRLLNSNIDSPYFRGVITEFVQMWEENGYNFD